MKAIVTGTGGFIGGNLMRKLVSEGNYVLPIEKDILSSPTWKFELEEQLNKDKPDVVFHVGAITNTLATDVNEIMLHNSDFSVGLALWCRANDVPIIFSSSASIYGSGAGKNLYAWSKYCAESVLSELGAVSLRYFNVYGGGEEHKGAMASMMYQGWLKHQQGEEVLLFPMNPQRDFVYIDDVVDANLYAFKNYPKFKGGAFDVGTCDAHTFEKVMELMGCKYRVLEKYYAVPQNYQFYTRAYKSRLMKGWEAKFSLEAGILAYLQYLKNKPNDSTNNP